MPAVNSVLVVGGGSAGNATAILFRRAGVAVDLVDIDPGWSALGSGITLCGNAFRVLDQVGIWEEVRQEIATLPAEIDVFKMGGPDYPGVAGMYRPTLQRILSEAVRGTGANVHLGVTVTSLEEINDKVHVTFSNGSSANYDLVVGADGINSVVRSMIGISERPRRVGLSIWRIYGARPEGAMIGIQHGGAYAIVGMNATSKTHMYAYVVEKTRDAEFVRGSDKVEEVHRLGATLDEPYRTAFLSVTDASQVDHRPFHEFDLGLRRHRGRVVIIGDAAHVCPPTVAQGAAMALEDAAVLAEMLTGADKFDDDILRAYTMRRHPRVSEIVKWSVQLCADALDPAKAPTAFMASLQHLTPILARTP